VGRIGGRRTAWCGERLRYDASTDRCTDAMYLFRAAGGVFRCLGDYREATA
jgi:hypothetical protein